MFSHLLPPFYRENIQEWIRDDCPSFDVGGFVVGEKMESAKLYCKSTGVLAGVPFAQAVFDYLKIEATWLIEEGTKIEVEPGKKVTVATIHGPCRNILLAERTSLNILSRASGVALQARNSMELVKSFGWHGSIAGTRKTTPGFKHIEKYALVVGGAATHRQDLSQMVMLKDNHIWSAGSISSAVERARSAAGFSIKIEVECSGLEEGLEAAGAGADIVMLDNLLPPELLPAAQTLKERFPHLIIEASGGISEDSLPLYLSPHIDVISRGGLTQGYQCVDFSLKIDH